MALTNWANGDLFSTLRDKFNAVITILTGGTSGQIPVSNGSGDYTWTTLPIPPDPTGNGTKELRVNTGGTAIEYITDFVSPEYNDIAGKVKDIAAASALVAAIASAAIGLLVFVPKIF